MTSKRMGMKLLVAVAALAATACNVDEAGKIKCADDASCPSDYPNIVQGVTEDACKSDSEFNCGDNCDTEYEAKIRCETEHPNCCNETECNNDTITYCDAERTAWTDCTERVRDACESG